MTPEEILATEAIIFRAKEMRGTAQSRVPDEELEAWNKENPDTVFVLKAIKECHEVFAFIKENLPEDLA